MSIEEELKNYAVKLAEGRATEGDTQRVLQLGNALKKGVAIPVAAPIVPSPKAVPPKKGK